MKILYKMTTKKAMTGSGLGHTFEASFGISCTKLSEQTPSRLDGRYYEFLAGPNLLYPMLIYGEAHVDQLR